MESDIPLLPGTNPTMTTATLMAARYETATPHDESLWDSASTDDSDPAFDQGDRDTTWAVTAATTVYESVVSSELAVPTTVFRSDWPFVWPLCATLALTVAILATNADLRLAELMFDRNTGQWALASNSLFKFIYHYGPLPGVAVGVAAAVVAVVGRWTPQRRVWWQSRDTRRACVFLALVLALGPGLIINSGFKSMWGRPRPSECVEFGGEHRFVPVGVAVQQLKPNSSFPSGHASIAFYWMAPGFVLAHRQRRWALAFFATGTAYGLAMGVIRMAQGGHFLSDVLWAGAIVYLTGAVLARWVLSDRREHGTT